MKRDTDENRFQTHNPNLIISAIINSLFDAESCIDKISGICSVFITLYILFYIIGAQLFVLLVVTPAIVCFVYSFFKYVDILTEHESDLFGGDDDDNDDR